MRKLSTLAPTRLLAFPLIKMQNQNKAMKKGDHIRTVVTSIWNVLKIWITWKKFKSCAITVESLLGEPPGKPKLARGWVEVEI